MKLKIIVDDVTMVCHDLGTNNDYSVKIAIPGNPNPGVLQKKEDDPSLMSAKDFLDYVRKYGTKGIGIGVEENVISGSKAWICDCDDIKDGEEVHCSVEERNGTLIVNQK